MVWVVLLGALLFASACDSNVIVPEDGHGASDGGDDGGTSASGAGGSDTSSSSSSPGWTVPPDRTYSHIDCDRDEHTDPTLYVEIWPAGSGCGAPPADPTDVLVLAITRWDGQPGTFTLRVETPHGIAAAGLNLQDPRTITGTLTIEPYIGTPSAIAWDLSVGAGRTDLSVCGHFDDFPCR